MARWMKVRFRYGPNIVARPRNLYPAGESLVE
jgi:hypothetical protein